MAETTTATTVQGGDGSRRAPRSPAPSTSLGTERRGGQRLDIQGLRAVAVLLVVADHLFGRPVGGFIGVDVFFVISGFLITGLLLREHERTGHISFLDFYRRRARRILPAATLVLVVTAVAAWVVLPDTVARSISVDAVWSFFFVGNYRFATAGTDYFAATAAASPLQHYWSLSVEEQFYFVWPWLMLLLLAVLARAGRRHHARLTVGIAMAAIVVASFAWGLHESTDRPAWAYFSTFARVWELGLGALLAICAPLLLRLGRGLGVVLAWVGLVMIGAGAVLVSAEQGFPVPWAALPVVGSALVIAGGLSGTGARPGPALWPLTNRPMTYIGDISYSLYLWHFPVIVLLAAVLPADSKLYYATAIVVMAVASTVAYHAFERVIHHSRWLEPRRSGAGASGSGASASRVSVKRSAAVAAVGVLVCASIVAVAVRLAPETRVDNRGELEAILAAPDDGTTLGAWRKDVARALLADEWPDLSPSIDELDRNLLPAPWVEDGCLAFETGALDDPVENAERCVYGDPEAERTMVLYGDSVGIAWVPALVGAFGDDWRIEIWAARQCTISEVPVTEVDGGDYGRCDEFRDSALDAITAEQPDVVIASSEGDTRQVRDANTDDEAYDLLAGGLDRTAGRLADLDSTVIYLPPPPTAPPLTECRTATATPADCVRTGDVSGPWQELLRDAAESSGADYVDVGDWFCVTGVGCPGFIGTTPVRVDAIHFTDAMANELAPLVAEQVGPLLPE